MSTLLPGNLHFDCIYAPCGAPRAAGFRVDLPTEVYLNDETEQYPQLLHYRPHRPRRGKLRILRFDLTGKAHSLRCPSFSQRKRCAGLRREP